MERIGFSFLGLLPLLPVLLAHLAGAVVAVVLLARQERRSTPAILALIGFSLLSLGDLASFVRWPLIRALSMQGRHPGVPRVHFASAGIGCCYSVFHVAAIACLIVAIWQAVSGVGDRASEEMVEGGE